MLGCGQAATFRQLLFWRWVTGIGSALQMTGAQLFLADISTRSNRARSLGINQSAALLGSLAGPAIGGLMADAAGLQAPFIFTGASCCACCMQQHASGWLQDSCECHICSAHFFAAGAPKTAAAHMHRDMPSDCMSGHARTGMAMDSCHRCSSDFDKA